MVEGKLLNKPKLNLTDSNINPLLKELRSRIKSLNPRIEENVRAYYLSYRFGNCFTYLWPTKTDIWVYFRTDANFKDNKKICENVPKGINANFNKRAKAKKSNVDYIFGLVEQSFSQLKEN